MPSTLNFLQKKKKQSFTNDANNPAPATGVGTRVARAPAMTATNGLGALQMAATYPCPGAHPLTGPAVANTAVGAGSSDIAALGTHFTLGKQRCPDASATFPDASAWNCPTQRAVRTRTVRWKRYYRR